MWLEGNHPFQRASPIWRKPWLRKIQAYQQQDQPGAQLEQRHQERLKGRSHPNTPVLGLKSRRQRRAFQSGREFEGPACPKKAYPRHQPQMGYTVLQSDYRGHPGYCQKYYPYMGVPSLRVSLFPVAFKENPTGTNHILGVPFRKSLSVHLGKLQVQSPQHRAKSSSQEEVEGASGATSHDGPSQLPGHSKPEAEHIPFQHSTCGRAPGSVSS